MIDKLELTHLDSRGNMKMVDISDKEVTVREAVAEGRVYMKQETLSLILGGGIPKGDVLAVARVAGIMAAKRTQDLIPMCHNILLDSVNVDFEQEPEKNAVLIKSLVRCTWKTGVEMEALTAVTVAALTVYDMCKAVDKTMVIGDVRLVGKTGGKSGDIRRAKVIAVNISEKKGVPKRTIEAGEFVVDHGLKGDAHAGSWHRQVSLLGQESIDKLAALGVKGLCTGKFAENITTEGIELYSLPIGTRLQIKDVVMEVTQIGKECHQKCAIYHQVGDCVMPKEGIFARVLVGGTIRAGDDIII